jgi:hypothetical protein
MQPAKAAKQSRSNNPVHGVYVYVDNYIGAAVKNARGTLLGRIARSALHGIQSIFPLTDVTGHVGGKDPFCSKSCNAVTDSGTTEKSYSASLWMALPRQCA